MTSHCGSDNDDDDYVPEEPKPEATALSLGAEVLISNLQVQVKAQTETIDRLRAENASLRDQQADEYKAACESYCELQNVLRVTTENLKKEIAENASLTARVAEHLVMFKSNDETFKKLRAENGELRERIDELHDEKSRANRAVDNLSADNVSLAATNAALRQNVVNCTKVTDELRAENARQAERITALELQSESRGKTALAQAETIAKLREAVKQWSIDTGMYSVMRVVNEALKGSQ